MKIAFIQTGGTIDKDYPKAVKGYAFEIGEPAIERIINKIGVNFEYEIIYLLQKDSLDLTAEDREKIVEACEKIDCDKIIITHGTDTMVETAKKLNVLNNKTIVITGSLKPERFIDSDASFNIGTAIAAVQVLPSGVYIAMNGRVYKNDNCKKDLETGRFVECF